MNWKMLTFVPLLFAAVAIVILVSNVARTGFIISRDVELSGGKQISFEIEKTDTAGLKAVFPYAKVNVAEGTVTTLLVEIPFERDENEIIDYARDSFVINGAPTVRNIGPALGEIFWQQTQTAFVIALIAMSLLVFVLYRSPVPSMLIILSAVSDIIIVIAVLSILGIDFSLPVMAALLMILGYGTDNNILLTSHMLKFGRPENINNAFMTGLAMYSTTVCALLSMYFISGSFVLQQMSLTLLIGLVVDMPVTWLTNAGLLRMWLERRV